MTSFTKKETKLYNELCDQADDILIKSGIRDLCIKCSKGKPWKGMPKWIEQQLGGCCNTKFGGKCKFLTPNGCGSKSLICKLWLCRDTEQDRMIKKHHLYTKWQQLKEKAYQSLPKGWDAFRGCLVNNQIIQGNQKF